MSFLASIDVFNENE